MSRPQKSRRICSLPENISFGPLTTDRKNHFSNDSDMETCSNYESDISRTADLKQAVFSTSVIKLQVDEFEAIRLIDLLGLNQVECAEHMNIARTTAQSIYNSARKKLAECLVNGAELIVEGGEYNICDGGDNCICKTCIKEK